MRSDGLLQSFVKSIKKSWCFYGPTNGQSSVLAYASFALEFLVNQENYDQVAEVRFEGTMV